MANGSRAIREDLSRLRPLDRRGDCAGSPTLLPTTWTAPLRRQGGLEDGPWATTTAQERGRVLFRLADKVRQNLPALAELECRNTGKPIVEAEYDLNDVATCFEYYGGLATKVVGYVNPVPTMRCHSL